MSNEMPNELKILAEKIAEFREKHRLTYQEMGEATGVDKSHIHRIENMAVYPSLKFLIRLSEYMTVPLFYLFLPTEKMNQEHCAEKIKTRLKELGWGIRELEEKSNIPTLRLMDLEQGISTPNQEEWQTLVSVLELSEVPDFLEVKFNLLRSILTDLGLREPQIDNLLRYVKDHQS